ncbi:MAG: hypothetical protein GF418_03305 [Chitinivibrionales bacterium]|nr:hypothetical protein [Chitinivibrionales bacterium]MBD3394630.1 hypothetical protein [Chitinivibrionales bacterium]
MATAIELYRKAYDLDYRKGDWQTAEEIYRQIAEKFPYSDEKEYALVHLERIEKLRANPRDQRLQPVRAEGGTVGGFAVLSFVLVLVLAVALGLLGYFFWMQSRHTEYQDLILQGMLSENIGNQSTAATLYKQAQETLPGEPLGYRFLAELYLKNDELKLAEIESRRWAVANPYDPGLSEFKMRLKAAAQGREESP